MNKIFKGFILSLMLLATITFFVARLEATYSKRVEYAGVSCNAGETITVGDLVCIKDADGEAYKADVDSSTTRPAVGVAITAGSDGTSLRLMTAGIMAGWSSLAEGSMGYASSTAGAITQTAPSAYQQAVAYAISTTDYYIMVSDSTYNITTLGVLSGTTPIILEGDTDDNDELTITTNDPNSDYTVIFPDVSGYITVFSNVNTPDVNLIFEGATANEYETTITVTDPTADRAITLPNETAAVMVSSLTTNATDAANSITGASNALVFEGATSNDYETSLTPIDPTADRTVSVPNETGAIMMSSLATNGTDIVNSVTGGTNTLVFEGSTANDYETTITVTDPTADRAITIPNASSGYLMVQSINTHAETASVDANELYGGVLTNNGSIGSIVLSL